MGGEKHPLEVGSGAPALALHPAIMDCGGSLADQAMRPVVAGAVRYTPYATNRPEKWLNFAGFERWQLLNQK